MRKTKIICTLGPASGKEKILEQMLKAGMNVARLNFSHGTHEEHAEMIKKFRKVRDSLKVPAAVMLDTGGPEIRTGRLKEAVQLTEGEPFVLTTEDIEGDSSRVSVSYEDLPGQLSAGNSILLDDGKMELVVEHTDATNIYCTVKEGGMLGARKSINIPYIHLNMPYLSEKDEKDLLFGIEQDVDFIAASFVRSKEDVIALRKFLDYHGGHAIKIISKIENNEGVENFLEILEHSDGIMVARGDMGVEVEFEKLPGIQKDFIRKCCRAGKIAITATQMLESMVTSHTPTRAEITDVANAVFDGTSAVMLSGETAMGVNPPRVVEVMAKIARQAEKDARELDAYHGFRYDALQNETTNAICDAACTTAKDLKAAAIIALTSSGHTARRVSKFRPDQAIVASTPETKTYHQLSMSWGVHPVMAKHQNDTDKLFLHAIDCAKQIDVVQPGDTVVITAGIPLDTPGTTNLLKVQTVS
ncbi:MAG: pyruvate kinase [Clostridiales bacterium]|nr:pyruvate kinase [Clostridiales bacterium]